MILLIDGYNVLKSHLASGYANDADRHRFIQRLLKFAARKGHKLIVVFDGGSHPWQLSDTLDGQEIIYSGYKQTADVVLRHLMAHYKGKDAMVISSDREVRRYAKHHGLTSIGAQDFLGTLQEVVAVSTVISGSAQAVKTTQGTVPGLDELMQEASRKLPVKPLYEESPHERHAIEGGRKQKKDERQKKKL